jgi:DMSO reductase anchor subunit
MFTLATAALVGLIAAPQTSVRLSLWGFLLAAGTAAGFSTLHLGRKRRAYRAVLNWRRSWLSREIILLGSFVAVSTIYLLAPSTGGFLKWPVTIVGFALLFAMDSVYHVTRTPALRFHSARLVLTGLLVLAMAAPWIPLVAGVLLLKAGLYAARKVRFARTGVASPPMVNVRPIVSVLRITVGIVVPIVLWQLDPSRQTWIVASVACGEVIDRSEFYLELVIPTPTRQMAIDLQAALAHSLRSASTGSTRAARAAG